MLTVQRTESTADFAALSAEWSELLEASTANGLFLTWDWLHTWWSHLAEGRRLFLLTVRRGSELVAIAPLALAPARLERLVPFRSLEFMGAGTVGSDYLDLIVRREWEDPAVEAIAEHLRRERLMLQLDRVSRAGALASRLADRLAPAGWTLREGPTEVCPFIRLCSHTWESYLGTLSSAHRYNFQRRLKNLHRRYGVEFVRVATEEDRGPALARLLQLHEARWSSRGGSMAFSSTGLASFHEELTRRALAHGWLRLFELRLDGRAAASLYGFRYRETFSFYQSGFDPAYAKDSVGLVTMGLAIKSAIEEGVAEYDLLHGDEAYKFQWAHQTRELARLELYPPQWRGLLCQQAVALGRMARRTARRVLRPDRPRHRGPAPLATES
jgi:CelD/BcsL family acetyltransferase involved in cellulose biosynthesis